MTTTPFNANPMSEFVFLSLKSEKIAIRKSSIHAFFPGSSGETVVEYGYGEESAVVSETFDEVCALLGVAVPLQEQS